MRDKSFQLRMIKFNIFWFIAVLFTLVLTTGSFMSASAAQQAADGPGHNLTLKSDGTVNKPVDTIDKNNSATGECFDKGWITITEIEPSRETSLEIGKTYTFTITVKYQFDESTTGIIASFAYDPETYDDLDRQIDEEIKVSSQTGEETISLTAKMSHYGKAVSSIYVGATLVGEGFHCSNVADTVRYTVNDGTSTPTPTPTSTPAPTQTPLPGENSFVFGFVYDLDVNALRGVTVTITGNNFSESTETNEDGLYSFTNLEAGDYTLTYEKEGYQTQTKDISLEGGEELDLGTVTMEEETKGGKISGTVVDIKGDPIENVRLKLLGLKTKATMTDSSDADGFFEFADLEADTYIITTKKKGYRKGKKSVKLENGEPKEIEIELRKTTRRGALILKVK